MITVKNLSLSIGSKSILENISFQMNRGEILAILGPNGAGKSSLLKAITGSQSHFTGDVFLDGRPIGDFSIEALSQKRAVLSQNIMVSFPFTAREIVMMGRNPHILNHETSKDNLIIDEILELIEANHLENRLYSTLSGGEQQRIQFARILAQIWDQEDAYLFLDEPTAALDLKHQIGLLELAQGLAVKRGFGVCTILHDLNLASGYADKILLLKGGKLSAFGNPQDVLKVGYIAETYDISHQDVTKFIHIIPTEPMVKTGQVL